jgi:hypothetical protein
MFIFPSAESMVSDAEEFNPSKDGVRAYFTGNPNLGGFLDLIASAGGKVLKPKTVITKEIGRCVDFMDTEGNVVSIHSRA